MSTDSIYTEVQCLRVSGWLTFSFQFRKVHSYRKASFNINTDYEIFMDRLAEETSQYGLWPAMIATAHILGYEYVWSPE